MDGWKEEVEVENIGKGKRIEGGMKRMRTEVEKLEKSEKRFGEFEVEEGRRGRKEEGRRGGR